MSPCRSHLHSSSSWVIRISSHRTIVPSTHPPHTHTNAHPNYVPFRARCAPRHVYSRHVARLLCCIYPAPCLVCSDPSARANRPSQIGTALAPERCKLRSASLLLILRQKCTPVKQQQMNAHLATAPQACLHAATETSQSVHNQETLSEFDEVHWMAARRFGTCSPQSRLDPASADTCDLCG